LAFTDNAPDNMVSRSLFGRVKSYFESSGDTFERS
jgi:hypothetical protein